jgi:hypothetical protein
MAGGAFLTFFTDRNDFGVIQRFLKQERPAESSFAACEPDRSR